MDKAWLPIRYQEFWDVPRLFEVEYRGRLLIFDLPFLEFEDEYSPSYLVYRSKNREESSTAGLALVQLYPVEKVEFDETKRAFVSSNSLSDLIKLDR